MAEPTPLVTESDFNRLWDSACGWSSHWDDRPSPRNPKVTLPGWEAQCADGRMHCTDDCNDHHNHIPQAAWEISYWVDSWTAVILCRTFLDAGGIEHEIFSDEAGDGGYAILTNYGKEILAGE
jgi:hypothetical protein